MAGFSITIAGDSALNLEFADTITPETSTMIRIAAQSLTEDPVEGIIELVPTFCSLMVYYNPLVITFDELSYRLRGKLRGLDSADVFVKKIVQIPVCYGGEYGPDIKTVADHAHLSVEEVIDIHSSKDYLIDMLGFLPGFAYLGGLDKRIHTPRLATPRTLIEAGSVGIGGAQTGIYPGRLADHRPHADPSVRSRSRGADPLCRRRVPSLRADHARRVQRHRNAAFGERLRIPDHT